MLAGGSLTMQHIPMCTRNPLVSFVFPQPRPLCIHRIAVPRFGNSILLPPEQYRGDVSRTGLPIAPEIHGIRGVRAHRMSALKIVASAIIIEDNFLKLYIHVKWQ